jgi:hypothetical protein
MMPAAAVKFQVGLIRAAEFPGYLMIMIHDDPDH